jgi:hypothetical protein
MQMPETQEQHEFAVGERFFDRISSADASFGSISGDIVDTSPANGLLIAEKRILSRL